jgi:hypothetical protein
LPELYWNFIGGKKPVLPNPAVMQYDSQCSWQKFIISFEYATILPKLFILSFLQLPLPAVSKILESMKILINTLSYF